MFDQMTAIVPVRAGSQRVPGKNLRHFYESPLDGTQHSLLSWKLENLSRVLSPEQILVSSNWTEALEVARDMGCRTHEREERFCTADAPFDQVIGNIAKEVTTNHMVWAPVTAPFAGVAATRDFLNAYYGMSLQQQKAGLVMASEVRNYFFMSGIPLNFNLGSGHVRTQDIVPITSVSWALTARQTESVVESNYMFSEDAALHLVNLLTSFDINDELDFVMAQSLISLYLEANG